MSETAKVRVVRCPKCSNLLPEVTDYSVYQCGGCGAVLRAKNNGVDLETFSEKSDEERVVGNIEKLSDRYEKMMNLSSDQRRIMDMSDGSESDVRSNTSSVSLAERQRIIRDRAENNRSNLSNQESEWHAEPESIRERNFDNLQRAKIPQELENMVIYREGFLRAPGMDPEITGYRKEGPSNLVSRPVINRCDVDDFNNIDYVGDDRAELLKKLDELKDHLSRSGNLTEKGKEKVPFDRRAPQMDPYGYENSYNDARFRNPPNYQNQYAAAEPTHLMQRQEMARNGFYHAPSHHVLPSRSHMLRQGPHEPSRYQVPPAHAYVSGPYMDDRSAYEDTSEPFPYLSNFSRHHPSCLCYQCCPERRAPMYGDEYADVPNDRLYSHHHDNPGLFGPRDYNRRIINPPPPRSLRSDNGRSHTRWPSDLNSEIDGFTLRRRPPRAHLPSTGGKNCRPIAGGAPFLTCYNCFELLLLPKKFVIKNRSSNRKKKIRCGACSTMIDFAFSDKKIVVSLDLESKEDNNDKNHNPVKVENKCDVRTTFSSEDYDNSGFDFHSMDRASKLEAEEKIEAERKDTSSSAATSANDHKRPPPPTGSSLQDYFEYSNIYNRSGEENKVGPNKIAPHQISRKESSATEIDLSSNEYSNTGTTFDSGDGSREVKPGRAAESFFAGIIKKKSFKDSSNRSNENFKQEKASVTVNGHLIPDRLIKKAEKLAGAIHPGHYWYDFRAGFWGAVGGPCLGIIPPFIEEFNYPMPEHCAGGNTHVFVNGRELNHKDLNLLGSRGLPTERDRSYIVEISGRVLDEDTGEELPGLGKLAPTVERLKHGFGMKAPKAAA